MEKKKIYSWFIVIAIISILATTFVYLYIKNESPIYVYDFSGYYETFKLYSRELMDSPMNFIQNTISSIRNSDYNCTPVLALVPFYILFKTSRFGYILGSTLCYVVPTIVLTIILTRKLILKKEENTYNNIFTVFICMVCFLYTRWWSPTLRGLPDIIAVIPMIIATFFVQKHSFIEKQKIYIPIIVGFMLYLCFLFRRYFVYAVIGFYSSLFIIELIKFIQTKENKKEKFLNAFKNFLIAGLTTVICIVITQTPLVLKILGENYSESYSAYQAPVIQHITRAINEFGYVILILAVIGAIYSIKSKEHRKQGLFCILNIIICYGTFMTVQAMGVHHYLTISLWIFILFIYGIYGIAQSLKKDIYKYICLSTILILMIINFATTYIFRNITLPYITQANKYCKFHYENFDELERLITDIDKLVSSEWCKFSALASSEILSDNILELLGTEKMKKSIVYSSAIDLRDGMSFNSLMSKYMVVTDIPQTESSETGQRVVSVPNNEIINGTSIGQAYTRISEEYTLQNNVKAYIYRKDRAFTTEEIRQYMEKLYEFYPQWREKYNELDLAMLTADITMGEKIGTASRYKERMIYLTPGYTPTKYKIDLNQKVSTLKLKMYIDSGMNINFDTEDPGNVRLKILKDGAEIFDKIITYKHEEEAELKLSDANELEFIIDSNGILNYDCLFVEIEDETYN